MADEKSIFAELFDLPFSLYRLSPLHFPLNKPLLTNLDYHAKSLARHVSSELVGRSRSGDDEVRSQSKLGTFKRCSWALQDNEAAIDGRDHDFIGILIHLEFEKRAFASLLLQSCGAQQKAADHCMYFPLLFTCLPNSLFRVLSNYLAVTFGPYIHPLRLSAPFLQRSVDALLLTTLRGGQRYMECSAKDVSLVLDFAKDISPSLKHLEITIKQEDLLGFLQHGQALLARRADNSSEEIAGAFTLAVSEYIRLNLAMDINHESISISRIICGSFSLAKDGKITLQSPSAVEFPAHASEDFVKVAYTDLLKSFVTEAEGDIKWSGLDGT